jgi:hypothetical protein
MPRNPNYAIQGEFRGARAIITNLNQIASQLDVTRIAATKTFAIDRQIKNFGIQMGLNRQQTTQMADTITGLSNVTGLSTEKTGALVNAMAAAGLTAEDLDKSLKGQKDTFGAISKGGAKNLEMMAELTGRHGLAASAVIKTNKSLSHMGSSLGDLSDDVTKWQKEYKIPGMIGQIPIAVSFAEKSVVEFGALLGVNSRDMVENTIKLGATFAKVYGTDIAGGIAKAQQHQQHFMQQSATNKKVFLGLADSFSPLTNALFEAGLQFSEVDELITKGQDNPAEFADQILKMRDAMLATGPAGEMMAGRLMEQVRASSSETVQDMLQFPSKIKESFEAASAAEKEAASNFGKGKATFAQMSGALRKVGATALDTLKNLLDLGKSIIGLSIVDDASKSFEDLHDWAKALNLRIKGLATSFADWRDENKPVVAQIQKLIKYGAILGATAATLASAVGALVLPFTSLKVLLTRLPIVGGPVSSLFGGLGKIAMTLGKKILFPLTAIAAVVTAIEGFGKALADPNLGGAEAMLKGVESVFVGIVDLVDGLLMGIPTKIVKFFFPKMRGTLADGTRRLFLHLQAEMVRAGNSSFSEVFTRIGIWMGEKLDNIWANMKGKLEGWKTGAREMGKNIGRVLGRLGKWAWDGIKELFKVSNWQKAWKAVTEWFASDTDLNNSFMNILGGVWDVVSEFSAGVAEEIFLSFGSSLEEVKASFQDVGDWFQDWADWFKDVAMAPITATWLEVKADALEVWSALVVETSKTWNTIKYSMATAIGWIIEHTFGPLLQGYAKVAMAMAEASYAANGEEADLLKANALYKERMKVADATAASLGKEAEASIKASTIKTKGIEEAAKAARTAADGYATIFAEEEKRGKASYKLKAEARDKNARERRGRAEQTAKSKHLRRKAVHDEKLAQGAIADKMRGGFIGRTEALMGRLAHYQGQYAKAGKIEFADRIGSTMSQMSENIDKFTVMHDPNKMMSLMKETEGLVGSQVLGEAKASDAYKTAGSADPSQAVQENVRKATAKAVPTPAGAASAGLGPVAPGQGQGQGAFWDKPPAWWQVPPHFQVGLAANAQESLKVKADENDLAGKTGAGQ